MHQLITLFNFKSFHSLSNWKRSVFKIITLQVMQQKRLGLVIARRQTMQGVPSTYDLGTPSGHGFVLFGFKWITFAPFATYCYS
jgi:hypothetical protein